MNEITEVRLFYFIQHFYYRKFLTINSIIELYNLILFFIKDMDLPTSRHHPCYTSVLFPQKDPLPIYLTIIMFSYICIF